MGEKRKFLVLEIDQVKNDAIENLIYYKYFTLEFCPFDLNLDGNFCDEFYKYILDIISSTKSKVRKLLTIIPID